MGQKITKDVSSTLHLRREIIWNVYFAILGDLVSGWTITHVVGTWTNAGTVANGNYFVATSSDGQQFIMCANDSATTTSFTWGPAGVLAAYSLGCVYSPTGGWVTGTLSFSGATITPVFLSYVLETSTTGLYSRVSIIAEPDVLIVLLFFKRLSPPAVTDFPTMMYAGRLTPASTDAAPFTMFFGEPTGTDVVAKWGYRSGAHGRVVNLAGNAFEAAFMGPVMPIGFGQTKDSKWVETDCCFAYNAATSKYAGKFKYLSRIDSSAGAMNTDGPTVTRVVIGDVTAPWE